MKKVVPTWVMTDPYLSGDDILPWAAVRTILLFLVAVALG